MKLPRLKNLSWRRCAVGACALALGGWLGLRLIPIPAALEQPPGGSLQLLDRNGAPLRETRTGDGFARPVQLAEVPEKVVHAMLAAEDKRFFEHSGVDWLAVGRAARDCLAKRRVVSGASTIT